MRFITVIGFTIACLFALPAHASSDAIETCADRHGGDYKARVSCLEAAIRGELKAASNSAPVVTSRDGRPTGLGAEQVIARSSEYEREKIKRPDPLNIKIEEIAYGRTGKAIFILANGQVWREKDKDPRGRRINTRKVYMAEIVKAQFGGGYRMKLEGVTRKLVVERVK